MNYEKAEIEDILMMRDGMAGHEAQSLIETVQEEINELLENEGSLTEAE